MAFKEDQHTSSKRFSSACDSWAAGLKLMRTSPSPRGEQIVEMAGRSVLQNVRFEGERKDSKPLIRRRQPNRADPRATFARSLCFWARRSGSNGGQPQAGAASAGVVELAARPPCCIATVPRRSGRTTRYSLSDEGGMCSRRQKRRPAGCGRYRVKARSFRLRVIVRWRSSGL